MRDDNYITIQGFMVNQLKLKGNELLCYALIYGFSQDNQSYFQGSARYVAEWLGTSHQTALNVLNKLSEKGLINKQEKVVNNIKVFDYAINLEGVKKFEGGVKNFGGGCKNFWGASYYNNINNNNIDTSKQKTACNSDVKKPKEKTPLQEFSNEVIKNFEKLEAHQIPIWFKRNCRCLSDILKFCGGRKEDIPMALECISICCSLMEKKGFMAGYEAVCRNLPYYYEEAKKKLRR